MDQELPFELYEDESIEEMVAEFVRIMAKYKRSYSAFDVAKQVFRTRKEPLRFLQAAQLWQDDLDIKERVDEIMLRGNIASQVDTKEDKLRVLKQIYEDGRVDAKDRIAAIRTSAELCGEVIKHVEKKIEDNRPPTIPTFVIKKYQDE